MNMRTRIAIALGSNQGDRVAYLAKALEHLKDDLLEDMEVSKTYETEPWGKTDQPKFLNAVATGYTEWQPPAILNYLKDVETAIGRLAREKNGPREIDLDLIAYGEKEWHSPEGDDVLAVPHPRLTERTFVLEPLAEVWPEWTHPIEKKTAGELLTRLGQ